MKIQKLTNKQCTLIFVLFAITAAVCIELSIRQQQQHISTNMSDIVSSHFVAAKQPSVKALSEVSVAQAPIAVKTNSIVTNSESVADEDSVNPDQWHFGGFKSATPSIPLNEKIVTYAVVELNTNSRRYCE